MCWFVVCVCVQNVLSNLFVCSVLFKVVSDKKISFDQESCTCVSRTTRGIFFQLNLLKRSDKAISFEKSGVVLAKLFESLRDLIVNWMY